MPVRGELTGLALGGCGRLRAAAGGRGRPWAAVGSRGRPWTKGFQRDLILLVWMAICIVSTIYEKEFFTKEHFGVFKELVQKIISISGKSLKKNTGL